MKHLRETVVIRFWASTCLAASLLTGRVHPWEAWELQHEDGYLGILSSSQLTTRDEDGMDPFADSGFPDSELITSLQTLINTAPVQAHEPAYPKKHPQNQVNYPLGGLKDAELERPEKPPIRDHTDTKSHDEPSSSLAYGGLATRERSPATSPSHSLHDPLDFGSDSACDAMKNHVIGAPASLKGYSRLDEQPIHEHEHLFPADRNPILGHISNMFLAQNGRSEGEPLQSRSSFDSHDAVGNQAEQNSGLDPIQQIEGNKQPSLGNCHVGDGAQPYRHPIQPFQGYPSNQFGYTSDSDAFYGNQARRQSPTAALLSSALHSLGAGTSRLRSLVDHGLAHIQHIPANGQSESKPKPHNSVFAANIVLPLCPKPILPVLPGGDETFWFWGLSKRAAITESSEKDHVKLTATFQHKFDIFWKTVIIPGHNQPTQKRDLGKKVPARFVSLEKHDPQTGEEEGFVRIMMTKRNVIPMEIISKRIKTLLKWIWHYHEALLNWRNVQEKNETHELLLNWLWMTFNEPGEGLLPVVGLTTRKKFKQDRFGSGQLYFMTHLVWPDEEKVRYSMALYLILDWYKSQDSWGKSTFSDEEEFWDILGKAVPPYLNKIKSNRARVQWSPKWEEKFGEKKNKGVYKKQKTTSRRF